MKFRYLLMVAGVFALAAPSVAAESDDGVRVRYDDLDLTTKADRKELDRRVDKAARKVCGMDNDIVGTRVPRKESRDCYREARQQLEARLATLSSSSQAGA